MPVSSRLLHLLSSQPHITASELSSLVALHESEGGPLAELVIRRGVLGEEQLFDLLSNHLHLRAVSGERLEKLLIPPETLSTLPRELARRWVAVPFDMDPSEGSLSVAMLDPTEEEALEAIRVATGFALLRPFLAPRSSILVALTAIGDLDDTLRIPQPKFCPLCAECFPESATFCPQHNLPLLTGPLTTGREHGELTGHVLERRYLLGGIVGSGGMGTVYEAKNLRTGLRCAVKVLRPELSVVAGMQRRLFRELQASSQIHHPNVLEIFDFGEDPRAGAFIVMEFLSGDGLDELLDEKGSLPLPTCLAVVMQLCSALSAFHTRGLVHCDLKPSNIQILTNGRVKLLDFGLVKPSTPEMAEVFSRITTGTVTFGTPHYMAPEVPATRGPLDPRSDIYSLGVILYEMILGAPPFDGNSPIEVLEAHRHSPVPFIHPRAEADKIPPGLELLLFKMLSKDLDGRPRAVAEVADRIQAIASALDIDLGQVMVSSMPPPGAVELAPPPRSIRAVDVTLPVAPSNTDLDRLRELARERRPMLVDEITAYLLKAIPRYRSLDPELLHLGLDGWLELIIDQLGPSPRGELPEALEQVLFSRSEHRFSATEIFGAFWLGFWSCRPLLIEITGPDLDRFLALSEQVEQRVLRCYLRANERYFSLVHQGIARTNDLLAEQNAELLHLRDQLDLQLRNVHKDLMRAEQTKARVADSISTALLLVQRRTRSVLLFNRAAEALSGLSASQVLGQPLDEIFHLVEGIPYDEFIEQVRLHGQVGLRKLQVRFPTGAERTLYIRGEAFTELGEKESSSVLIIVEDITERETIIASFSRYVSRDVVNRILSGRASRPPVGEPRRAFLLAGGLVGFPALLRKHPSEVVVDLLDEFVRAVGNAVFPFGGAIDTVVGERILVYFAGRVLDPTAPLKSALQLGQHVLEINRARLSQGRPLVEASVALHAGEVVFVDVGGERRMVHLVLGVPAEVVAAVQRAAAPGEILVTGELASEFRGHVALEAGPDVVLEKQGERIATLRVR
jgi:PAS domain S-box-containing protein